MGRSGSAPADAATSEAALDAILKDPSRRLTVADVDGNVDGTMDLLIAANLTHAAKPWAVIENVVVASAARRRGVATQLMQHAIDAAQAAGCYKVLFRLTSTSRWPFGTHRASLDGHPKSMAI